MSMSKYRDDDDGMLDTFQRWLSDGTTWLGIFRNEDLGHYDVGRLVAMPFDAAHWDNATLCQMRAPDHREIGLGWRYILIAKTRDAEEAVQIMKKEENTP